MMVTWALSDRTNRDPLAACPCRLIRHPQLVNPFPSPCPPTKKRTIDLIFNLGDRDVARALRDFIARKVEGISELDHQSKFRSAKTQK